ncbi:hypothetical protein AFLA_004654 [Aspergillus flavus NRRL3357]|nr:hypothetical protein AFLA_004654 [Aspergillus flavus NRRL3357]
MYMGVSPVAQVSFQGLFCPFSHPRAHCSWSPLVFVCVCHKVLQGQIAIEVLTKNRTAIGKDPGLWFV